MTQPAWMAHAWAELGQRERPGDADNPRIQRFYADVGHGDVRRDEVAWCAAFAGACLERSGQRSTRSLMARSYLQWGETLSAPRLGAIAVLSRSSDPASGHVGFWIGETADTVLLLGGNQSDSVSVAGFAKSRLLGLRWSAPEIAQGDRAGEATDLFETALAHVLLMEGGFTDDPHDPGGPTNRGITLAVLASHLGVELDSRTRGDLVARLRQIDDAIVRSIYRVRYWVPSRAAGLPPQLALMHFDAAVNHGVGGSARLLQRALGVDVDGEVGPVTLAAARRIPVEQALDRYAAVRRDRYRELTHFWRFGRGWLARVDRTLAAARLLPSPQPVPSTGDPGMTETEPSQPSEPAVKWWGNSITVWGAGITALTTVLPVIGPMLGLDISGELARQIGEQVVTAGQAIGGLVGTAMTLYGRSRASTRLERREFRIHL